MALTYRQLKWIVAALTEDELNQNVSVEVGDEFYEVSDVRFADPVSNDVLDPGHVYLITDVEGDHESVWRTDFTDTQLRRDERSGPCKTAAYC